MVNKIQQEDIEGLVSDLSSKQETLVSWTNIKTINGTSLLWSGNITISWGGSTNLYIQSTLPTVTVDSLWIDTTWGNYSFNIVTP